MKLSLMATLAVLISSPFALADMRTYNCTGASGEEFQLQVTESELTLIDYIGGSIKMEVPFKKVANVDNERRLYIFDMEKAGDDSIKRNNYSHTVIALDEVDLIRVTRLEMRSSHDYMPARPALCE